MNRILLGVNIDHVATLRQARGTRYPDPVQAAIEAEQAGADSCTLHLREDRRHIQERDVELLKQRVQPPKTLEGAARGGGPTAPGGGPPKPLSPAPPRARGNSSPDAHA